MCDQGMSIPMAGEVILKDSFGNPQRNWTLVGAYLKKYIGPDLNSNQPALAVSRIELIYNGCF
jgi:phage tail-like protein